MNRWYRFLGVAALVISLFGVLSWFLVEYDDYHAVMGHFALGLGLGLVFFFVGGLRTLFTVAGKRVLGFGSGVMIYTVLFVSVLVLVNFAASRFSIFYFDSTEQNVFTLAPQTLEVLAALDKPLVIRAFFLGGDFRNSTEEDLVRRVASESSNLSWLMIDPEKEPTLIAKYDVLEDATLHLSYGAGTEARTAKVVGRINEQNLVNSILKLSRSAVRKVYYVTGHNEPQLSDDRRQGYLLLREALEGESYQVFELDLNASKSIPVDADLLLLASPKKSFEAHELKQVSDYLLGGGRALLLHEPRTSDAIRSICEPLGIRVGADVILDPSREQTSGASAAQPVVKKYGTHPITQRLSGQTLFSIVSSVTKNGALAANASLVELALSNEGSWAETDLEQVFSETPSAGYDQDQDIKGPVSLGVALRIPSPKETRVVVFGDADFVTNQYLRQAYNKDLFLNSVGWAIGESAGITIRPRAFRESSERITNAQANVMFLITGILLPEVLLLIGLGVWWTRRV